MGASGLTLAAVWRRSARLFAGRTAVVGPHRRLTYAELDERATRVADALRGHTRIAVLSPPRPEYVELYLGAAKAGVTVVALNTRLHQDEIDYCLELSQPDRLFDFSDWEAFVAAGDPAARFEDPDPEAIHNVLFTSGTTGRPKGAMISYRAAATRAFRSAHWFGLTPDDGFIGWLPLFHCGGDEPLYATLATGGRIATFERPDPEAMYAAIERERLTWSLFLPGVITDFLQHPARGEYDLSSLRFGIGYANMMPGVVSRFTAELGEFWDAFGQTESSFLVAYGHVPRGSAPSLRKQPTPYLDIAIVDDELRELPAGEPGECVVRGPSVMSGYLGDPQATEEAFRGGWLHTGDILVRHEDGTLEYVDRKKYLIKTGGENVYPAEVEAVIAAHPAVQEVCVIGVPDEYWGEAIKAIVVLAEGRALTEDELVAHCRERLAGYKRPRAVRFMAAEEIPRSTTGKVLRHELS